MKPEKDERISGYLDGELDGNERAAFERELETNEELRHALEEMRAMQQVTSSMRLAQFSDDEWDRYWGQTYNRLERHIGWILLSIGAGILFAAGFYEFVREVFIASDEPLWRKAAIGLLCLGGGVLVVSVIRERLHRWRNDPYRKVRR